jgi:hypothetical protein
LHGFGKKTEAKNAGGSGDFYESRLEASRHLLIARQNHGTPPDRKMAYYGR